jgi:hypothetical protein
LEDLNTASQKKQKHARGESMFSIDNLTSLEKQCHGGALDENNKREQQQYDVE